MEPRPTAGVFSVNLIVDAIISPVVGHLLDRYGPKRVVVGTGCLLLASGLWLSSQITSLWQFYIFSGLVSSLGFSFLGMIPHVVLISEWFSSNRASALGAMYAGTGVGILLLTPLIEWLISTWGWERALQSLAVTVLVLLAPLAAHAPVTARPPFFGSACLLG